MDKCKDKNINCFENCENNICSLDIDTPCNNKVYCKNPEADCSKCICVCECKNNI